MLVYITEQPPGTEDGRCGSTRDPKNASFRLLRPCDQPSNFDLPATSGVAYLVFQFNRYQGKTSYCESCREGASFKSEGRCSLSGPPSCQSVEICGDQRDNDCDGEIDEGCSTRPEGGGFERGDAGGEMPRDESPDRSEPDTLEPRESRDADRHEASPEIVVRTEERTGRDADQSVELPRPEREAHEAKEAGPEPERREGTSDAAPISCRNDCDCPETMRCNVAQQRCVVGANSCPLCTQRACPFGQVCRNADGSLGRCCCTRSGCGGGKICCAVAHPTPGSCVRRCLAPDPATAACPPFGP